MMPAQQAPAMPAEGATAPEPGERSARPRTMDEKKRKRAQLRKLRLA